MAARSTWKGFLKLGLVSVPVKAYTATASSSGEVRLNQLHAGCNARIQYKKTCPIHGEVPSDEIVSGYEFAKGQYVVVDTDELQKLRSEDDKAIQIDTFITPDQLDSIYLNGKGLYLVPDGPVGQKSYAVLHAAMVEEGKFGVARVVLHGKEQVVLVRPIGNLIIAQGLDYDFQVTKPSAFEEEAPKTPVAPAELNLAKTLIEASTSADFDFSQYKDVYTDRLTQLIEAKVAGKELVAPPAEEHAQVINLMDALQQSVAELQKKAPETAAKPPKKMAASTRSRAAKGKKKTS